MQSIKDLNGRYPIIFGKPTDEDEDEDRGGDRVFQKYGWVAVTDSLANSNPMNYEYFDNMNTVAYLNLLSFKIYQSKEEKRKQKLHQMRLDAKSNRHR